uniref:Uncharacterized protein n=1 Tax=Ascaris lumbricoides TaxID=6252 RepID=A0A0M3IXT7_ASCLU
MYSARSSLRHAFTFSITKWINLLLIINTLIMVCDWNKLPFLRVYYLHEINREKFSTTYYRNWIMQIRFSTLLIFLLTRFHCNVEIFLNMQIDFNIMQILNEIFQTEIQKKLDGKLTARSSRNRIHRVEGWAKN